eukprot:7775489-Prorocentrum_lima.AAC.1
MAVVMEMFAVAAAPPTRCPSSSLEPEAQNALACGAQPRGRRRRYTMKTPEPAAVSAAAVCLLPPACRAATE